MAPSLKAVVEQEVVRDKDKIIAANDDAAVQQVAAEIAQRTDNWGLTDDKFSYRVVVAVLGVVVVIVTLTYSLYAFFPPAKGNLPLPLPDALISLGSAAVGALAGLLAPTPRKT